MRSWPFLLLVACAPYPLPEGGWDPDQPAAIWLSGDVAYWLSSEGGALVFRLGAYEAHYTVLIVVFASMVVLGTLLLLERLVVSALWFFGSLAFVALIGPWIGDEEVRIDAQGATVDVGSWYDLRHRVEHIPVAQVQRVEVRDRVIWWTMPYAEVVVVHDAGEEVLVRLPQSLSEEKARRNLVHAEHIAARVRARLALSEGPALE